MHKSSSSCHAQSTVVQLVSSIVALFNASHYMYCSMSGHPNAWYTIICTALCLGTPMPGIPLYVLLYVWASQCLVYHYMYCSMSGHPNAWYTIICTALCLGIPMPGIYTCIYTGMYIYPGIYIHTCIYTHVHTYIRNRC